MLTEVVVKRVRIESSAWDVLDDGRQLLMSCGHRAFVSSVALRNYGFRTTSSIDGSYWNCMVCVDEPMDADEAYFIACTGASA